MKHVKLIGYLFMAMIGGSQFITASPYQKEWQDTQIVNLLNISEQEMQDFLQGKIANYILECPAEACLPLTITLRGEFFSLESTATPFYIKILKSCYMRCEEDLLFSTDLQKWEKFANFFTGNLTILIKNINEEPIVTIGIDLNQKKIPQSLQ